MNFNDQEVIAEINAQEPDFLTPRGKVAGKAVYVCPRCKDHEISRYTGKKGPRWKCMKCGFDEDVLGLYQEANGGTFNDALEGAASYYGISISNGPHGERPDGPRVEAKAAAPVNVDESAPDLVEYIKARAADLDKCDYLTKRGISVETQKKFWIGYDPDYHDPRPGKKAWGGPRLIIPTSRTSITARSIESDPKKSDPEIKVLKAGPQNHLFNGRALENKGPVFVVEGEIDALSLIDLGYNAVGIGGTSGTGKLIECLKARRTDKNAPIKAESIILALDNDKAGKDATGRFLDEIRPLKKNGEINIPIYAASETVNPGAPEAVGFFFNGHKDANESLQADRKGLSDAAAALAKAASDEKERYALQSVAGHLQGLIRAIKDNTGKEPYSTGFRDLDSLLSGGIRPRQVCYLGALSSLGKTTFLTQIADNMAESGRDVLYFSLETPEDELIAKIISRYTLEGSILAGKNKAWARNTYQILDGKAAETEAVQANIMRAFERLEKHGRHLHFICSIGDTDAAEVREIVQNHIRITGNRPAVFIDYLQIMKPLAKDRSGRNMRYTSDRAAIDATVSALKHLAVDLEVPVIAISSLNRDNYTEPINKSSFKESGGIEYGSDILIGLQYPGMDYKPKETQSERKQRIYEVFDTADKNGRSGKPVDVELKVLKNRNGGKGKTRMQYDCWHNHFKEMTETSGRGRR